MTDPVQQVEDGWRRLQGHPAFRAGALMAGVSWVILQGASVFGVSTAVIRGLAAALVLISIVVTGIAWLSATRPPTAAAAVSDSKRRRIPLIPALVVLLLLGFGGLLARGLLSGARLAHGAEVVAVLPFTTAGAGVELLGDGMVDLLSTNLDQVEGMRAVNPRTVLHQWRRQGADPDLEGALAVGRAVDAGSIITGSAVAAGANVRLSATIYELDGGVLGRAQTDGPSDALLAQVDRLAAQLVREVWRSRQPVPQLRIAAITTSSLPAMNAYLRGERFYRASSWDSARAAFEEAVRHDSTFALAHARLSEVFGWSEALGSASARTHAAAARRASDKLPARERVLIAGASLHETGDADVVDTLRAYVQQYPDDPSGWHMLGDVMFHAAPLFAFGPGELRAAFDSAIARDPTFAPPYQHALELALQEGDSAQFRAYRRVGEENGWLAPEMPLADTVRWGTDAEVAAAVVAGMRRFLPARPASFYRLIFALHSRVFQDGIGTPDLALAAYDSALAFAGENRFARQQLQRMRVDALLGSGRLREAKPLLDSLMVEQDDALWIAVAAYASGVVDATFAERAVERVRAAPDSIGPAQYVNALIRIAEGDAAGARSALGKALASDTTRYPGFQAPLYRAALGWVLLIEGDTVGGIAQMRRELRAGGYAGNVLGPSAPVRTAFAAALASRAATRAEGIRHLEYIVRSHPMFAAHFSVLLGDAYVAVGNEAEAARAYARALHLWQRADPAMRATVDAAQRRLERLTAEN